MPGWRSLGVEPMERKSQGPEVSEAPVASTVLCITLSDFPLGAGGSVGSGTQPWALCMACTLWDVFHSLQRFP